jgi:hypothetical protein
MFLYARLVLDYLSTNIFYNGEEVKTSIDHLPDKLSELYATYILPILLACLYLTARILILNMANTRFA